MFKYAVILLIISFIAGGLGLTNTSSVLRRVSMVLFAVFFLLAAIVFGLTFLIGDALIHSSDLVMPVSAA